MRTAPRWEVGSAFPLILPTGRGWTDPPDPLRLYGSGRQALVALLRFGRRTHGWTAVHVPAYYCPEVVDDIAGVVPVRRYDAGPVGPGVPPEIAPADAVLAVSYFGAAPVLPASRCRPGSPALIVDATHDPLAPWLIGSGADYAFASLRKTLPLPDGGALWSTTGRELPVAPPPTDRHRMATGAILSAMCLKAAYLGGAALDKAPYLALYADGEERLRGTAVSGISDHSAGLLRALPAGELRDRRIANAAVLAAGLRSLAEATVRAHAFGVVIEFASHRHREAVRAELISREVYPAVLWVLRPHEVPPRHLDFSRRMLFLHTDARWDERDMRRVASLVRQAHERGRSAGSGPADPPPRPRPVVPQPPESRCDGAATEGASC